MKQVRRSSIPKKDENENDMGGPQLSRFESKGLSPKQNEEADEIEEIKMNFKLNSQPISLETKEDADNEAGLLLKPQRTVGPFKIIANENCEGFSYETHSN